MASLMKDGTEEVKKRLKRATRPNIEQQNVKKQAR